MSQLGAYRYVKLLGWFKLVIRGTFYVNVTHEMGNGNRNKKRKGSLRSKKEFLKKEKTGRHL